MAPITTIKNRLLILAPAILAAIWAKFAGTETNLPNVIIAVLAAGAISWITIEVEYFLRAKK